MYQEFHIQIYLILLSTCLSIITFKSKFPIWVIYFMINISRGFVLLFGYILSILAYYNYDQFKTDTCSFLFLILTKKYVC